MWPPHRYHQGQWRPAQSASATGPSSLRVVTLNTWFAEQDRAVRLRGQLAALRAARPDVIALQEVTSDLLERMVSAPWFRSEYAIPALPHLPLASHGYGVFLAVRPAVECFSWHPLDSVMGRGLLAAQLPSGTTVGTVHLESTAPFGHARRRQLAQCTEWMTSADSALLVGDFNFDDTDPDAPTLAPWVDVWTAQHPTDAGFTVDGVTNPYRRLRGDQRQRIDRVLLRDPARRWIAMSTARFGTQRLREGCHMSDHYGLEVELMRRVEIDRLPTALEVPRLDRLASVGPSGIDGVE